MTIEESLKKILFSASCCPDSFLCQNCHCEHAVAQLPETGNWFITYGHAGFNSKANNGVGYQSKNKAISSMKRYLNK